MRVAEFTYHLPPELIAQEPLLERSASRLLRLSRSSHAISDGHFHDFPELLRRDDLLVFNNTRVLPARLYGRRSGSKAQPLSSENPASREFLQGRVEVLLTRQISQEPNQWECLVRPGRKIGIGERLFFGEQNELEAEVMSRANFGERTLKFAPVPDFLSVVEKLGHIPLPPYIDRADRPEDKERYQTVYAQHSGSVAAPTAGLHFTPEILERIRARGIETAEITLHVGLGTFQPVRVEEVERHTLHREFYCISPEAAARVNAAVENGRRVVAVGTTTVRALEDAGRSGRVHPGSAEANIFIYPPYPFRIVGGLLTNFHLPQSSLLMLVCAFGGTELVLEAYRHAVQQQYRFYSYGDCMFLE